MDDSKLVNLIIIIVQLNQTLIHLSTVLLGYVPIMLWFMSSRSEHDTFALLAGVLVFYQNKEKKLQCVGCIYMSQVPTCTCIHHRGKT